MLSGSLKLSRLVSSNSHTNCIQKKSSYNSSNNNIYNDYSLSKNYFDPLSSSPPNNFMEKLEKRINEYSKGSN